MRNFENRLLLCFFLTASFLVTPKPCSANTQMNLQVVQSLNTGTTLTMIVQIENNSSGHVLHGGTFYLEYDPTDVAYSSFAWGTKFSSSTTYPSSGIVEDVGSGVENPGYNILELQLGQNTGTPSAGSTVDNTSFDDLITITFNIKSGHQSGTAHFQMTSTSFYGSCSSGTNDADIVENATGNVTYDMGTGWCSTYSITPLPVTLLSFTGKIQNQEAILNWSTASEINNAYFTIERSQNGIDFIPVLAQRGQGNSNTRVDYEAFDENPLPGTSYYRLKQIDNNGKSETFKIIAVNNVDVGSFTINSVSPTAFAYSTQLDYTMPEEGFTRMVITNSEGKNVYEENVQCHKGENMYKINSGSNWMPDLYVVTLYYNGKSVMAKMIKR